MQHMNSLVDLGQEVAQLRRAKGLTQKQVGELTGLGQSTLARFETGNVAEFGSRKLLRVLEVLGYELAVKPAKPQFTLEDALEERRQEAASRVPSTSRSQVSGW